MTINVIKIYTVSSGNCFANTKATDEQMNTVCVMQTFAHTGHYTISITSVKMVKWVTGQIFLIWSQFYYTIFCNMGTHEYATTATKQKQLYSGQTILDSIYWAQISRNLSLLYT